MPARPRNSPSNPNSLLAGIRQGHVHPTVFGGHPEHSADQIVEIGSLLRSCDQLSFLRPRPRVSPEAKGLFKLAAIEFPIGEPTRRGRTLSGGCVATT